MKPTALVANSPEITRLNAECPGCTSHIPLRGKCPDGRSWTAVASPYWPLFARRMAQNWAWAQTLPKSERSAHLAGWDPAAGSNIEEALHATGFQPSGKRAVKVIASRIAAGVQTVRRALPQLLPEGLGSEIHLRLAHQIVHPFARSPGLTRPVRYAIEHGLQSVEASNKQRKEMKDILEELELTVSNEMKDLSKLIHPSSSLSRQRETCESMREVS